MWHDETYERSYTNRVSRYIALAIAGGLVSGLSACHRSVDKPVYPVTGKVLYKGKPAEGALVTLFRIG